MKSFRDFVQSITTIGAVECGAFCALLGILLSLMILFIGFWQTLFVVLCALAGLFIGGVSDKTEFIKEILNKIIPDPNRNSEDK